MQPTSQPYQHSTTDASAQPHTSSNEEAFAVVADVVRIAPDLTVDPHRSEHLAF
jgi:hypothetical protein